MKKFLAMMFFTVLTTCFMLPAHAFNGYSGSTYLGVFPDLQCSTGLTCTKVGGKMRIVSSPTISTGDLTITGLEAANATVTLKADESDDSGDDWLMSSVATGNAFTLSNDTSGSQVAKFTLSTAGEASLTGSGDSSLTLIADNSDDNGDEWKINSVASGNAFVISNDTSGSQVAKLSVSTAGAVTFTGSLTGHKQNQVAATATTITASQCGSTFINSGAVEMELPEASTVLGCQLTFIVGNASTFTIDPDAADQLMLVTDAAGDSLAADAVGESIVIEAISASAWAPVGAEKGTWTDSN